MEEFIVQRNGYRKIPAVLWKNNSEEVKAVIVLVHGFGEHALRYNEYIHLIYSKSIAVLGFDQAGHGKSEEKRGVIHSYSELLDDANTMVLEAKKHFPNKPIYLYGHSMGGNVSLNYVLQKQPELDGVILTSPWLTLANDPSKISKSSVSALSKVLPNVCINGGLDVNHISTIKIEVEKYKQDPLVHGKISLELLNQVIKQGVWALDNIQLLHIPMLLCHGDADQITSFKSSQALADKHKQLIQFKAFPGMYHELHNDASREELSHKIIEFILR